MLCYQECCLRYFELRKLKSLFYVRSLTYFNFNLEYRRSERDRDRERDRERQRDGMGGGRNDGWVLTLM